MGKVYMRADENEAGVTVDVEMTVEEIGLTLDHYAPIGPVKECRFLYEEVMRLRNVIDLALGLPAEMAHDVLKESRGGER